MAIGKCVERLEKATRVTQDNSHIILFGAHDGANKENTAHQKIRHDIQLRERYPDHHYMVIDLCNAHREHVKRLEQEGNQREFQRLVALGIIERSERPEVSENRGPW